MLAYISASVLFYNSDAVELIVEDVYLKCNITSSNVQMKCHSNAAFNLVITWGSIVRSVIPIILLVAPFPADPGLICSNSI